MNKSVICFGALVIAAFSSPLRAQVTPTATKPASKESVSASNAVDPSGVLLNAYKREFAFLEAERNALRQQLTALDQRMSSKVKQAQNAVERLQQVVAQRDLTITKLQKEQEQLESVQATQESPESIFTNLQSRASVALVQVGRRAPKAEDFGEAAALEKIKVIFEVVERALTDGQKLHRESGQFFNREGKRIDGELLRVGYVASYGNSDAGAGMLRPAGDGRLQLVPHEASVHAARSLARGDRVETLPIFLYENLEKAVDLPEPKTVDSILKAGGVIASIIAG